MFSDISYYARKLFAEREQTRYGYEYSEYGWLYAILIAIVLGYLFFKQNSEPHIIRYKCDNKRVIEAIIRLNHRNTIASPPLLKFIMKMIFII